MKLTRSEIVELIEGLAHYARYSGDVAEIKEIQRKLLLHDAATRELPVQSPKMEFVETLVARTKDLEAELLTAARIIRSLVPLTDITAADLQWADEQLERLNKEKGVNHD